MSSRLSNRYYIKFDANKLKRIMRCNDCTQQVLADLLGVTRRVIVQYLSEEKMPIGAYFEILNLFDMLDSDRIDKMGASFEAHIIRNA